MHTELSVNLNIEVLKNLCRQQEVGDYFASETVLIMKEKLSFLNIMKEII